MTIGNNEGMTFPHEDFNHLYDDRQFEVLIANLYHDNGKRPEWAKANTIYETKNGMKIAVTGLNRSICSSLSSIRLESR